MSEFKDQWEAKKLLKKAKKKAKKRMMEQGYGNRQARESVNRALKNIVNDEHVVP